MKHSTNRTAGTQYFFLAALCLTLTLAVHISLNEGVMSAEVVGTSESSEIVESEVQTEDLKQEERKNRSYGFLLRVESGEKETEAFRKQEIPHLQKRIEHQRKCRKELRHANRDAQLSTALRCYRAQLTLNLESLRKERSHIEKLPGASEAAQANAIASINVLTDAIVAIIDGIDTGVYTSVSELQEAKENLTARYWTAKWLYSTQLRADTMLTWLAHFILQLEEPALQDESTSNESATGSLAQALDCLEDGEKMFRTVIETTQFNEANGKLSQAHFHVESCLSVLEGGAVYTSAPNFTEPEEGTEGEESTTETEVVVEEEEEPTPFSPYITRPLKRQLKRVIDPPLREVRY